MFPYNPFTSPEHADFLLPGGKPAALLVHGFPGTPLEMRPLANALHAAGWTCRGLLLPGFGPDIESLPTRRAGEWRDAILDALTALGAEHAPLLLVGNSLGGALCLWAASRHPVDGLALLAPFWKLRGPLWASLPLLKRLFPRVRPFRRMKLDFTDPQMRKGMAQFMPGMDLDDQRVRQAVRDFILPVGMFDEIRRAGAAGYRGAARVRCPVLVLQGERDETVRPERTDRLVRRLAGTVTYRRVPAGHDLPFAEKPAYAEICAALLDCAASLVHR